MEIGVGGEEMRGVNDDDNYDTDGCEKIIKS